MHYTKEQIDAVIEVTGAEIMVKHILGIEHSYACQAGMQLSHDADGVLTRQDIDFINSLLP
tara:strand:+ start:227 stop:409 length:183 start_codon:yes stop_codon:yes gene_type:complete